MQEDFWLYVSDPGGYAEGSGVLLTKHGLRNVQYWGYGAVNRVRIDGKELNTEYVCGIGATEEDFDPNQPARPGSTTMSNYEDWLVTRDITQRIFELELLPPDIKPDGSKLDDDDQWEEGEYWLHHFVNGRNQSKEAIHMNDEDDNDRVPSQIVPFYPK